MYLNNHLSESIHIWAIVSLEAFFSMLLLWQQVFQMSSQPLIRKFKFLIWTGDTINHLLALYDFISLGGAKGQNI